MGIYLNPGNEGFAEAVRSQIYVDKTGLIAYTNKVLGSKQRFLCVSRPRRFGKTMAEEMLVAYYCRSCDSKQLFADLDIEKDDSFEEHLNQYNVIFLNMVDFLSRSSSAEEIVACIDKQVSEELKEIYQLEGMMPDSSLPDVLNKIYATQKEKFIFVIDEWDCVFREKERDAEFQRKYLDYLRVLLKDKSYVALAYMTGILPIKKYGTHSALNMFEEYSMLRPMQLARFMGFTEQETEDLCREYGMDISETKHWYDGYILRKVGHIYSPKSVVDAMRHGEYDNYWTNTETYEALRKYISMNFDGLKDAVTHMLGGGRCKVRSERFTNDMTTFKSRDDVLTLLIHLGYLAYDAERQEVFIPNEEVRSEFVNAMEDNGWQEVMDAISASEELLEATCRMEADKVAKAVSEVHMDTTSIVTYNNENSLSCVLALAYYCARKEYTVIRELPSGKGFADMVFLPRKESDKPALLVELKWDKSEEGAIAQIKEKKYVRALQGYIGKILLVGISYDKKTKEHQCVIEAI